MSQVPLPISAVLIARNEAERLPACLASLAGWVAEIVVVVNDCSDGTEEVARRFGARVVPHAWENFREQKNAALAEGRSEWVLALDADESVSPELRAALVAFVAAPGDEVAASSSRLVTFLGRPIRHGDWYPDRGLRLVRKGRARWIGAHDHCKLVADGPVRRLAGDLLHDSFPTLASLVAKTNFHADNFVRTRRERGEGWGLAEALFRPGWRFFRSYVLRLGFLDGYSGLIVSVTIGYQTLIRYARIYEAEREGKKVP